MTAEASVRRFQNDARPLGGLVRQGCYVGNHQITASELGFDQLLRSRPTERHEFLAKAIDNDIDGAVADRVLGSVKQFSDFISCAEGPGLRYKMRQQATLRARQVRGRAVFAYEQIAAWLGSHTTRIGISVRCLIVRIVSVPLDSGRLKSRTMTSGLLRLTRSKKSAWIASACPDICLGLSGAPGIDRSSRANMIVVAPLILG